MKIRKFNAILAAALLGGGLLLYGAGGFVIRSLPGPWAPAGSAAVETPGAATADNPAADAFSPEGKQVVTIPWRGRFGQMPDQSTLKKWVVGDRIYYEVSGPLNPRYRDKQVNFPYRDKQVNDWNNQWGTYTACEVFFPRSGRAYDQWLVTPTGAGIVHHNRYRKVQGASPLAAGRYRTIVKGDRIAITFWCSQGDGPANIVFNYNDPTATNARGLSWVTTGMHEDGESWDHHHAEDRTYP